MKTLQDLKNLIENIEEEIDISLDDIPLQIFNEYVTEIDLYLTNSLGFISCTIEIS